LNDVDPETAARLHPNDTFRIIRALEVYEATGVPISRHRREHHFAPERYRSLKIGITLDRSELYDRINQRTLRMLAEGLGEEVAGLLAAGVDAGLKPMRSIGYKEMVAHLGGELTQEEAADAIARETRRYAKRQLTWFRRDPEIKWVEYPKDFDTIRTIVIDFFE
jgi:tRNA dimethylallyltransferase